MQPHLERRASDSSGRQSTATASAPVGVDAFKQLLVRHGQRYVRDGKPFCLASLEILEYEHVKRSKGDALADDLDQLGRLVLKHQLRAEDRVCAVQPGSFLVLLPDTSVENGRNVMERILHKLNSSHRKRSSAKNRASGVYQVASTGSSAAERIESEPARAAVREFHLEALVESVGYRVDLSGTICKAAYDADNADLGVKFSGTQELWLERYSAGCEYAPEYKTDDFSVVSELAQDEWVPGKCVVLRAIRFVDTGAKLDSDGVEELLKRLRVLQSIEHAGISRVQDFHVVTRGSETPRARNDVKKASKGGVTVYVVESLPNAEPLSNNPQMSPSESVELLNQLANLGIFLQSLVPPISPVDFSSTHIARGDDGSFVLTDYQVPYLIQALTASNLRGLGLQTERSLASLGKLVDELKRTSQEHDKVLSDLAERLLANPVSDSLNSMFKVRAETQRILQRLARS